MDNNKTLEDFVPNNKSVYSKSFDGVSKGEKIKENDIIEKIKLVFDPEIPVNIYDLGLIYNINVDKENNIKIIMTLTSPNCPVAGTLPKDVGEAVGSIEGIFSIQVELVWDPVWTKDMMSEDAKLALDIL
jgi:FeS assembly SUF system protein